ncbi:MAG: DUF302 domain-containing protein [Pseudomonadota bacterium]
MQSAIAHRRISALAAAATLTVLMHPALSGNAAANRAHVRSDGVVTVASRFPMAETVSRLKADIAAKGITFFAEIDQQALARSAGIELPPSTLLVFGNPALGSHFITANAQAGLDWPVRLLVSGNRNGKVSLSYTNFDWIARRHAITTRGKEFATASKVIASIADSVRAK